MDEIKRPRGRPRTERQTVDTQGGYQKGINHGYGRVIPTSKAIAAEAMKYLESVIVAADLESRDFTPEERRRVVDHLSNAVRELRRRGNHK